MKFVVLKNQLTGFMKNQYDFVVIITNGRLQRFE